MSRGPLTQTLAIWQYLGMFTVIFMATSGTGFSPFTIPVFILIGLVVVGKILKRSR